MHVILQLVGVAVGSSPRQARVYDLNTGDVIATLDEAAAAAVAAGTAGGGSSAAAGAAGGGAAAGGGEFVRGNASACFSPSGEWGSTCVNTYYNMLVVSCMCCRRACCWSAAVHVVSPCTCFFANIVLLIRPELFYCWCNMFFSLSSTLAVPNSQTNRCTCPCCCR
jgi:hypothetical protein